MYSTALTAMHSCHPGHARVHSPLLAFDFAVHGRWYVHVQYVQTV